MIGIALSLGLLTFATTASAQLAPITPAGSFDGISKAVRSMHQPFEERTTVSPKGRTDYVFHSAANFDEVVAYYKAAYAREVRMPHNLLIQGWHSVMAKRVATFTVYQDGRKYMLIAREDRDGTTFTVWGNKFRTYSAAPTPNYPDTAVAVLPPR